MTHGLPDAITPIAVLWTVHNGLPRRNEEDDDDDQDRGLEGPTNLVEWICTLARQTIDAQPHCLWHHAGAA